MQRRIKRRIFVFLDIENSAAFSAALNDHHLLKVFLVYIIVFQVMTILVGTSPSLTRRECRWVN